VARKLANRLLSENGDQSFLLRLAVCHKGVPRRLILGPMLFSVFINYLDYGIEYPLTAFTGDTKLCVQVDTLEGKTILQRDLDRMEKWASKSCVKFKTSAKSCT